MLTWKRIGLALIAMVLLAVIAAAALVVAVPSGREVLRPAMTPEEASAIAQAEVPPRPMPRPRQALPQQLWDDPLWRGLDRYGEGPHPSIFDPPDDRTESPATRELERSSPDWKGIGTYSGAPPAELPSR